MNKPGVSQLPAPLLQPRFFFLGAVARFKYAKVVEFRARKQVCRDPEVRHVFQPGRGVVVTKEEHAHATVRKILT